MNCKSVVFAAAASFLGLTACTQDEVVSPSDNLSADAVQITASIGNPFVSTRSNPIGTLEQQATFNNGDIVAVDVNSKIVRYQLTADGWKPLDGKFHTWLSDGMAVNAWYPCNEDGSSTRIVVKDQSTEAGLAQADWMTYGPTLHYKADGPVNIKLSRTVSRFIVKIVGFKDEFSGTSKVADVRFWGESENGDTPGAGTFFNHFFVCSPFVRNGDGGTGTEYIVLSRSDDFMNPFIRLSVNGKVLKAYLTSTSNSFESGKSYTFNIRVGKEKMEIESVTVEDWSNTSIIPGGTSSELVYIHGIASDDNAFNVFQV